MKKIVFAVALLTAAPAFAEGLAPGLELGMDKDAIGAALNQMGYEVRKLDMEDGMLEAYVVKGSEMAEVYIDLATGKILRVGGDD